MEAIEITTTTEQAAQVLCHWDHHFRTPILGRLLYGQPSDALQPPVWDQGNLSVRLEAIAPSRMWFFETGPTVVGPALCLHEGKATGRGVCACGTYVPHAHTHVYVYTP